MNKDLPHIFEKFYRAGDVSSEAKGGTGLGLAITNHIVQSRGGEVWVKSELGRESTFTLTLPTKTGKIGGERSV